MCSIATGYSKTGKFQSDKFKHANPPSRTRFAEGETTIAVNPPSADSLWQISRCEFSWFMLTAVMLGESSLKVIGVSSVPFTGSSTFNYIGKIPQTPLSIHSTHMR